MKIIKNKKEFQTYRYNELDKVAQEKAVNDYINFVIDCYNYEQMSDKMKKAVEKAEAMQTPWFVGSYIWEYCKEEILEAVKDYTYFKNGNIFNL